MPRRAARDISEYIEAQIADMHHAYRKNLLSFLISSILVASLSILVAALACYALVEAIRSGRTDWVAVIVPISAVFAFINLFLGTLNVILNQRYKHRRCQEAYRSMQAAYIAYLYGVEEYAGDQAFARLRIDIARIVAHTQRPTRKKKPSVSLRDMFEGR